MNKNKKQLEEKINDLVQNFEKENDIKVGWINIEHEKDIGFANTKEAITTKINLKND